MTRRSISRRGPLMVIVHDAGRTGAARVLYDLLRGLKQQRSVPLAVRLESDGPLADDLLALDDGVVGATPAAVLVNRAPAALVRRPDAPAALFIHEDRRTLEGLPADVLAAMERYDRLICVSNPVAADVVALGFDRDRVRVVPPLVVPQQVPGREALTAARRGLGAASGRVLVLGCAEEEWFEEADRFVALADRLRDVPRLAFAWLGLRSPPFAEELDGAVARLGLEDRFRWLGEVSRPEPYLAAADVVVVTSSADPEPLVPVQAALLGTPTVGFAAGGMAELVRAEAALGVPFPDVDALARTVARVAVTHEVRDGLVLRARRRWRLDQAPQVAVPRFARALGDLLPPPMPLPAVRRVRS